MFTNEVQASPCSSHLTEDNILGFSVNHSHTQMKCMSPCMFSIILGRAHLAKSSKWEFFFSPEKSCFFLKFNTVFFCFCFCHPHFQRYQENITSYPVYLGENECSSVEAQGLRFNTQPNKNQWSQNLNTNSSRLYNPQGTSYDVSFVYT